MRYEDDPPPTPLVLWGFRKHQKDYRQMDEALEYTRKWRVTANFNKCAILVCNEDMKWAEKELLIVD